jgi:hypothetical protein
VHPLVATHPLDVVAGDETAEAVSDHVHLLVAGLVRELLDRGGQVPRRGPDVVGQDAVVEGGQVGEPASAKRPLQRGEDGVVVDDAVHQQDRRGCRVDGVVHQAALMGTESAQGVPVALAGRLADQSERVRHQVGGHPTSLAGHAGGHPGHVARQDA